MDGKFKNLRKEIESIRQAAVVAHIAGDKAKAECLTGKAVGLKSTLEIAERSLRDPDGCSAIGELEGMERAISLLQPLPKC